jgi:hypothetical protein
MPPKKSEEMATMADIKRLLTIVEALKLKQIEQEQAVAVATTKATDAEAQAAKCLEELVRAQADRDAALQRAAAAEAELASLKAAAAVRSPTMRDATPRSAADQQPPSHGRGLADLLIAKVAASVTQADLQNILGPWNADVLRKLSAKPVGDFVRWQVRVHDAADRTCLFRDAKALRAKGVRLDNMLTSRQLQLRRERQPLMAAMWGANLRCWWLYDSIRFVAGGVVHTYASADDEKLLQTKLSGHVPDSSLRAIMKAAGKRRAEPAAGPVRADGATTAVAEQPAAAPTALPSPPSAAAPSGTA